MGKKLDLDRVKRIIMEYIGQELGADHDVDVASDALGHANFFERPDGGVNARFHYHYDEDGDRPWDEHSALVFFRGSMHLDPQGNVVSKSFEMASKEIRAVGPRNFLLRKDKERVDRRAEKARLVKWEDVLKIGDIVDVRFFVNGAYFEFFSEIARINPKSFRVAPRGTQRINSDFEGKEITVPRRLSSKFSENNGVFPLDSDGAIDDSQKK